MAKRKRSAVQPVLFEDITPVVKKTANEYAAHASKEKVDYTNIGITGDMDDFRDYIKNGRNNNISWKRTSK